MHPGSKDEVVKSFEGDNFKMKVQKKTYEEFKNEGSNKIVMEASSATSEPLNVQIPYDSVFDDLENEIIFASSFSSETGSKELLI